MTSVASDHHHHHQYRPPSDCPVCGSGLALTRLTCGSCGSELSGVFETCSFCGLSDADRALLRVFLVSRGNMREVERHLGVSYPTARQRYAELLAKLGMEQTEAAAPAEPDLSRADVLAKLARGELDIDGATDLLRKLA